MNIFRTIGSQLLLVNVWNDIPKPNTFTISKRHFVQVFLSLAIVVILALLDNLFAKTTIFQSSL